MTATVDRLPPKLPVPGVVVGAVYALRGGRTVPPWIRRRYGDAFRVRVPGLGAGVAISDPELVKQVFTAPADVLHGGDQNPLTAVLGEKSPFALDEDEHLRQRRLLLPPFHGERMGAYAGIFEDEARRELATWPQDREFPTLRPFMRITLNAILRAVFGARGPELGRFRSILPRMVTLGSLLAAAPWLQRDLGRRSPWTRFRALRARYDRAIDELIAAGRADPALEDRTDVLAMLLCARYEDGQPMSRDEVADELLSLLVAGHETTAATLAWAVERLRRHPAVLARLTEEVRSGGRELREATIREVQRSRPVITTTGRSVNKPFRLGEWTLPVGTLILVDGAGIHNDPRFYDRPEAFDPDRFLGTKPETYQWLPFGGGRRRCPGAAFAHLEMDVVLRVLLRDFELVPTCERSERQRFRGVAFAPARGGRARVHRRTEPLVAS